MGHAHSQMAPGHTGAMCRADLGVWFLKGGALRDALGAAGRILREVEKAVTKGGKRGRKAGTKWSEGRWGRTKMLGTANRHSKGHNRGQP